MPHPHSPLHSPILRRIHVVPRELYLAGVAAVALVSLDPLASTGRVWPLNPHQGPCEDVNAQLVVQGLLPRILVGHEGVPLRRDSLLGNPEYVSRCCRLSLCSH
jgi:hypothetical protein